MTKQQQEALVKANEVRLHRVRVKAAIGRGDLTIADALVDPGCQSMKVGELLVAQRRVGAVKAIQVLKNAGATSFVRVQALSDRQRGLISEGSPCVAA